MKKIILSIIILTSTALNAQLNLGIGVGQQYGLGLGSRLGYKLELIEPNIGLGLAFGQSGFSNQKHNIPVYIYTLGVSYYQQKPKKPFSRSSVNTNISYCYARYVGTDSYSSNFKHYEIHSICKNGESTKVYLGGKLRYGLGIGMSIAPKTNTKIIRCFPVISLGYIYRFGM
jgi:hypothetical protein